MKKIMNFVLFMLCLFSCNIAVNAAAKVNSVVQEIRNEKDRTDREKLTVKKEKIDEEPEGGEVSFYYKGSVLKKIISVRYYDTFYETAEEYREYYIKNNKVYFIYEKMTNIKHDTEKNTSKVNGIYETRYYFDSNGNIVRYVDSNGNIHENNSQMREADKEIRLYKPSFIGNRL